MTATQFGVRQPQLPLSYATALRTNIQKRWLRPPHSKKVARFALPRRGALPPLPGRKTENVLRSGGRARTSLATGYPLAAPPGQRLRRAGRGEAA